MFSVRKAIALSQQIISFCGKDDAINYTKLIKLSYFCDRTMLRENGRLITGDRFYSKSLGPVSIKLYDLIQEYHVSRNYEKLQFYDADQYIWNQYMTTNEDSVCIEKKIEGNELDQDELQICEGISFTLGNLTWNELIDYFHEYLPEWVDPRGLSKKINEEDIVAAFG